MKIGVPRETAAGEKRVALTPDSVARLRRKEGLEVVVQSGAGDAAYFSDEQYREAGAAIAPDAQSLFSQADIAVKVQRPSDVEVGLLREGTAIVALLQPLTSLDLMRKLAAKNITSFSMESIPRIARAQRMDVLSSQSSVAGYKAVLMAADSLPKHFPLMMTAAGTMPPAKGLVIGAGVAGLQAIATARRLGAVMHAFDVRPAVKEQVESLGATFLEDKEVVSASAEAAGGYAREQTQDEQRRTQDLLHRNIVDMDFVVATALVPGRPAPKLITEEMVKGMRRGAVIVDIAAETGGNCALTVPGETVVRSGVTIHGPLNLPSAMPLHASQMYSRNMLSFLDLLIPKGAMEVNMDDAIIKGCCITHERRIVHEQTVALAGR
jgi:NAD(P) transhydrogenase subunit alpha